MPKKISQNTADVQSITYEQAFEELEKILRQLENEHASLEETLAFFERGKNLVQRCTVLLDEADLRLQILNEDTAEPQHPDAF